MGQALSAQALQNIRSGNVIGELTLFRQKLDDDDVVRLAEALDHPDCRVTELYIRENDVSDVGISAIARTLVSPNCNITVLSVSDNRITDNGASFLAATLSNEHCKLTHLYMDGNQITDVGAAAFASSLVDSQCQLMVLSLWGNQITQVGVSALATALASPQCSLAWLNIANNKAGPDVQQHINQLCEGRQAHVSPYSPRTPSQTLTALSSPMVMNKLVDPIKASLHFIRHTRNTIKSSSHLFTEVSAIAMQTMSLVAQHSQAIVSVTNSADLDLRTKTDAEMKNAAALKRTDEEFEKEKREYEALKKQMEIKERNMNELSRTSIVLNVSLQTIRHDVEVAQQKSDKYHKLQQETEELVTEIGALVEQAQLQEDAWRMKISKSGLDEWDSNDFQELMVMLNLKSWHNPLVQQRLTPALLLLARPSDILHIPDGEGNTMSFGQASLLLLTLKLISTTHDLPALTPSHDPNLSPENAATWTVDNVEAFFRSRNLPQVASALQKGRVSGLVLVHMNDDSDLDRLGITQPADRICCRDVLAEVKRHVKANKLSAKVLGVYC
eukprot:c10023_g1_i1.p1 GENE.c10023_g1_i1~~c10023_g1_i1.p1  ORF type:complete len:557 (-),score=120.50 c10023_g1_i1:46-1716(-)